MNKFAFTLVPAIFMALVFNSHLKAQSLINLKSKYPTIRVGGPDSDIPGFTNKAIQIAVDALPNGGGTVLLSPGRYLMSAPVSLKSNVKLIGSGDETILERINGVNSKMAIDADYGELKVAVENASGFKVGMSIQITDSKNRECWDVSTAKIVDIVKDTLYFDSYLIRDYKSTDQGFVTNAGSCILVKEAQFVSISNLKIDGNKDNNDLLDGCNGGGIAILKARNVTIDKVNVTNFNGEGITWQITDSVSIMNSRITGCTNMGMHPGSGSPHTVIQNTKSSNNKVGLFLCWRVSNSLVSGNDFSDNTEFGISTGHKDVDVLFANNVVSRNGKAGVVFRNETPLNSPHRTIFTNNIVEDNGSVNEGVGFLMGGNPQGVILKENVIRNSPKGKQRSPIFVISSGVDVKLNNNKISGHSLGDKIHTK